MIGSRHMRCRLTGASPFALVWLLAGATLHAQTITPATGNAPLTIDGRVDEQAPDQVSDQADVVVTGSLIRGIPGDSALPVAVITSDDLAKTGSPTLNELSKILPISSGTDGETNQFTSGSLEGVSNLNLRGLGPARTLVLWNGRRIAQLPLATGDGQFFVDTNLLPVAAVGRIEILKDGAAALYGSDAVAGVVNFITDRRLKGLTVAGDFRLFDGTDGEYTASAAYGWQGPRTSVLATFGYQHRSEVSTREFDFTTVPASVSFQNGYSGTGNPGVLRQVGGAAAVADPGCGVVGGTPGPGSCFFQFIPFDNIVEKENRFQAYAEATHELSDRLTLHAEALFAQTTIPEWKTSPSYAPNRPTFFVPASHPGLQNLLAANPSLAATNAFLRPGALAATGGINVTARPFGNGGFPAKGFGAQTGSRRNRTFRLSGAVTAELTDQIALDVSATYQEVQSRVIDPDTFVERFANAVRGLGGPNCTGTTPGANGCVYYNPFSNAIQRGAINGQENPGFVPALANTPELANFLTGEWGFVPTNRLLVVDALVSGETPIQLGGGAVAFALGVQYRKDWFRNEPYNDESDVTKNPCPTPGVQTCASRTGLYGFFGPSVPLSLRRDVGAAFAELKIPVLDNLEGQLAIRYEDYGGGVGSTVNPKGAVRFEPVRGFTLRGSVGTTFRGPQLNQLDGFGTSLQFIAPAGAFKGIDTFGVADLKPEKAFSYNFGAVVDQGGFQASIDYYNFRFRSPIIIEPFGFIVGNVLAGIASGRPSPLADRVTFVDSNGDGINQGAEIERVRVNYANGPRIRTDGLDATASYRFDVGRGFIRVGAEGNYQFKYKVGAVFVEGLQVAPAFNGINRLNLSTLFVRPLPRWKGNAFAEVGNDLFNLRYVARHVTDYRDERFDATPDAPGARIPSFTTHDLYALVQAPQGITLSVSVVNFTDEDPPFARTNFNYDTYTHNPFGRTFRFGVAKKF